MPKLISSIAVLACVFLTSILLSAAMADEKAAQRADPRQATKLFLDAALNQRLEEAAAMGEPGKAYSRPEKIKEFRGLKLQALPIESVHADATSALSITESVKADHGSEGPLLIALVKKENAWWIRDVDLETEEKAKEKLDSFLKAHADAKAVADEAAK